jgi:Tol biopolymer transport system component
MIWSCVLVAAYVAPVQQVAAVNQVAWNKSDLYVMGVDGSGVRKLVTLAGENMQPAWSPDGKRLAFVNRNRKSQADEGHGDIYVVGSDGKGLRQVTKGPDHDAYPVWTSEGIFFERGAEDSRILQLNLASGKAIEAPIQDWGAVRRGRKFAIANRGTVKLIDFTAGTVTELTKSGEEGIGLLSPDEKTVLFAAGLNPTSRIFSLISISAPTVRKKLISGYTSTSHAWSPDSTKLQFLKVDNQASLHVHDIKSGTTKQVYKAAGGLIHASQWTAQNRLVLSVTQPNGSRSLILLDPASKLAKEIAPNLDSIQSLAVAPRSR